MRDQAMVANGDPKTGENVEQAKHCPVHPGVIVEIRKGWESDQGAECDKAEQKNGAVAYTLRGMARGLCTGLSHGKISRLVLTADTRFFLAWLRSIRKDQQSQKIYVNYGITQNSSKARK